MTRLLLLLLLLLPRLRLFLLVFPVSLFHLKVLPRPATPCVGRLCIAGVESMWVYCLSLVFPFSYIPFLRHVCVSNRLLNSSTSQTRASQNNFLLNVVKC